MSYGLHVIRNPVGTYCFVGTVPMHLSYRQPDGSPLTPELAETVARCGPGIVRDKVAQVTWPTEEAARAEAAELGFKVEG